MDFERNALELAAQLRRCREGHQAVVQACSLSWASRLSSGPPDFLVFSRHDPSRLRHEGEGAPPQLD